MVAMNNKPEYDLIFHKMLAKLKSYYIYCCYYVTAKIEYNVKSSFILI